MVYSIGYSSGFSAALIGVYKLNKDALVLTPSQETEPMWVGFVPILVIAYLAFLQALPSILDLDGKQDKR
jgi:hypothetical protein